MKPEPVGFEGVKTFPEFVARLPSDAKFFLTPEEESPLVRLPDGRVVAIGGEMAIFTEGIIPEFSKPVSKERALEAV